MENVEITKVIPHRYPFLFIDRVLELEPGRRAVAVKNVTANEWFFEGHFPGRPIMPGVLIVEALAQTAAVALLAGQELGDRLPLFAGIEQFRFRRPVQPGDQLRLEFEVQRLRGPVGKGTVRASVDGTVVAEGVISFALAPAPESGTGAD